MTYNDILLAKEGYVGFVTLNRPDRLNTFSSNMAQELNFALLELDRDEKIRVIVIAGAGKAFCTGVEISEYFGKTQQEYRTWVKHLMDCIIKVMGNLKKPVITSARGYAVAYGGGIIAASDLAVVAEGTLIGFSAVNAGLFCMGPAVPLSRSIGRKRCLEMLLTGDLFDASDALNWGFVNKVAPNDQLENVTKSLADKIARKSPLATQMGKQAFYGMSDLEFNKALDYSNEVFASLCMTEDAHEGVEAFLNKREPIWKGK